MLPRCTDSVPLPHLLTRGVPVAAGVLAGLTAAMFAVTSYSHLIEPNWLEVTHPSIQVHGLPSSLDGVVIAQLSDFHLRACAGPNEAVDQAIAACNALRPDLVVLTGDYLGERQALPRLAASLSRLEVRPAFAVLGNHDYRYGPRYRRSIVRCLTDHGIELLDNRAAAFERNGSRLWLVGVGDGFTSHDHLDQALAGLAADDRPRVLLSHYPDLLFDLPSDRFELALAGHSHGAQIHLPFVSAVALQRSSTVFDRGFYRVNGVPLYVNRGLGTSGRRLRLFSRPELTLLRLLA